jgi:hypothetical protein
MENHDKNCIICKKNEDEIPLTKFDYKQTEFWICPQHIPVIIHDPSKLTGLLPDAEKFPAG